MKKNKHLLLWSSLGTLALLVTAAVKENLLREWLSIQRSSASEAGPLDVRLRQLVVPGLRATDRCVTCHVGMAPGEQGISGEGVAAAHPAVGHDPAELGCTVCHGGQGRATEKADAHGDVPFWPEPMIPLRYAYAGCGSCHTHLHVPDREALALGERLFERHDCLACHRVDGRGGTIRPAGGGMEGPDLSRAGAAGYDAAWYAKHVERREAARDGAWKDSFGPIEADGLAAIGAYLSSRVGAPGLVEAKALFHSLGCLGCHQVGGVGGDDGPDLSRAGEKDPGRLDFREVPGEPTVANWLAEHFRWPAKLVPGSQMPALGLTEEEVDLLVFYTLSLRRHEFPEAYWPADRIRAVRFGEREFATDGATLYGTFCAACHGPNGEGRRYPGMQPFPAIGGADFLRAASDEFIAETVRRGRPGRRMPAWGEKHGGLRPGEISELVLHLRRLGGVAASPPDPEPRRRLRGDAAAGALSYAAHCAGCHGASGEGGEGPALRNPVLLSAATDAFLIETIGRGRAGTPMAGFLDPSPVRPALSNVEIEAIVAFIRTWEETRP